jgi:protein-tyrosine kinase
MSRREAHLFERAIDRLTAQEAAELGRAKPQHPPQNQSSGGVAAAVLDIALPPTIAAAAGQVASPVIDLAALGAAGMVIAGAQRSRLAEEWRVTASHLLRSLRAARPDALRQAPPNVVMITSPRPGEGKSFSAINLAGSLSRDRMAEVVLLDVDTKPGALTDLLGLSDRPGLFDLVADRIVRAEDLIVATAVPGLAILPVGRRSPDGPGSAAERTITRSVVTAIEALARRFSERVLILDTPPCLATSDASTLASSVAQVAMIIEAERTQRYDLEAALELVQSCPNITLVLNKIRGSAQGFGGYTYYYG